jgi:hypothetical protein
MEDKKEAVALAAAAKEPNRAGVTAQLPLSPFTAHAIDSHLDNAVGRMALTEGRARAGSRAETTPATSPFMEPTKNARSGVADVST